METIPSIYWESIKAFLQSGRTGRIELITGFTEGESGQPCVRGCVIVHSVDLPQPRKFSEDLIPKTIWRAIKRFMELQKVGQIWLNIHHGKVGSAEFKYRVVEK